MAFPTAHGSGDSHPSSGRHLGPAGGLKDFADKKRIKILRDGKLFKTVNYKDLISGKHPEFNILLMDNDHVIVN